MIQTKEILKSYFETGDYPTEQQFVDLIDSMTNESDVLLILNQISNLRHTYNELKQLVDSNSLVAGSRYILTDYQTKYYIEGTNSASEVKTNEITQQVSGYAFFNPGLPLTVGDEVEVTFVPDGIMGIEVGDIASVSAEFTGYYLKFSNSMQNYIGIQFKYNVLKFSIAPQYNNITILDDNNKPIIKPDGVINTEVHDGGAYMQMTADENRSVPIEEIALVAISENKFSHNALSLTYIGDILEYDFTDDKVINDSSKVIGARNGFIRRRINEQLNIDIDKDWRVQRYRRYRLDEDDWNKYILNSTNNDLYKINNYNACSLSNESITDDHKYFMKVLEAKDLILDFTKLGTENNIFLSGIDTAPPIVFSERFGTIAYKDAYSDVYVKNPKLGKDHFIIPLVEDYNPKEIVDSVISKIENTIFLDYSSQYGASNPINVRATGGISNSTFFTGCSITSETIFASIFNVTSFDFLGIYNTGTIAGCSFFATGSINNHGYIGGVILGGAPGSSTNRGVTFVTIAVDSLSVLYNSIIGGKRIGLTFNNTTLQTSLLVCEICEELNFSNCFFYLTAMKSTTELFTLVFNIDLGTFKNAKKDKFGYYFDVFNQTQGRKIFNNNQGDLLYEVVDGANNNSKETFVLSLSN